MKIKKLVPEIYTQKFQETLEFYTRTLKFTCFTDSPTCYAFLAKDSIEIMVSLPNNHHPFDATKLTGSLLFLIENIENFWQEIKQKSSIVYPLQSFDYGMKEFAIYDNNGIILRFCEEILD